MGKDMNDLTDKSRKEKLRFSPQKVEPHEKLERMDSYKAAHIETATPERLLVMLYEGAIKFLGLGLQAMEVNDIEGKHRNILKAEAILLELMSVLDMDMGGEVAVNLYQLYDYMYRQLVQANIHHEPKLIHEVIGLLEPLRLAWNEAADTVAALRADGKFEGPSVGAHNFAG